MSESEDEDDYLNMPIDDAETAEDSVSAVPVASVEPEHVTKINEALQKPSAPPKGLALLQKMGYKQGESLGVNKQREDTKQPVVISMKSDQRGGIGAETAKKRNWQSQHDEYIEQQKRHKAEFRDSKRSEQETRRLEKLKKQAQRALVDFVSEQDPDKLYDHESPKSLPVEVRGLIVDHQLFKALRESRNARMHGDGNIATTIQETDANEVIDSELEEFGKLPLDTQLDRVTDYLRDYYFFCFWCGEQYSQEDISECPGRREYEH